MIETLTVRGVRDAVRTRVRTATEICHEALARIAHLDPQLHAFNTVVADRALGRAESIDRDFDRWRSAPLTGVPVALKDNLCTRDVRTTASSRILERFVPPYDATVVARLEAAGAIVVGKTNCDEFAMGSSNENSAFGPTRNPWALDRIPGGSSGGSAAAVAAGMAPMALGSDTGGSVRQPAVSVRRRRPEADLRSRVPLRAHRVRIVARSNRTADPHRRRCRDRARRDCGRGSGRRDQRARSGVRLCGRPWRRTGAIFADHGSASPGPLLEQGVDPEVRGAVDAALQVLQARGATVVGVDLPHAKHAIAVYYLVATAEASSNLARYDGVRYGYRANGTDLLSMYAKTRAQGFGPEVKRRIMLGTYVLSAGYYDAYYLKAQQVRTLILRDYEQAFSGEKAVDVIAMPTSPTPAFRLGERVSDPLQMYLADIFTVSANLAGLPAISVPCGFTADRLPIGLQLTGRRFDEATLLRIADAYERDTEWRNQRPSITSH